MRSLRLPVLLLLTLTAPLLAKEDLTDDDCAPDELVDQATGLCAPMCGNESDPQRPNNGCGWWKPR